MPKVLIVDDDRAMTGLLKTLLEMEPDGFEVSVVARGLQALEKAHANPPDVFMVDYNLNDIDGIELVGQIRQDAKFSNTPVIMASGLDVEQEALASGVDLFLLKPFEPGDLPNVLLRVIGR